MPPAGSPEAVGVTFTMSIMDAGSDVDVELAGPDVDRPRAVAEDVKGRLWEYAGVHEVTDSFRAGTEGEARRSCCGCHT